MALHGYISCRLVIYCDPFCIEDCNTVIFAEGANGYEWFLKTWKMCALRAFSGILCCGSNAMWVYVMIYPLGILIGI